MLNNVLINASQTVLSVYLLFAIKLYLTYFNVAEFCDVNMTIKSVKQFSLVVLRCIFFGLFNYTIFWLLFCRTWVLKVVGSILSVCM